MVKQKDNGAVRAELLEALEATPKEQPIDAVKAQAALDADREARGAEFLGILERESKRLRCVLVAVPEMVGKESSDQKTRWEIATSVRIVPR